MPNGIAEVSEETPKQVNAPTELGSKNLNAASVEQMSARRIHETYPEPVPDIQPEPKKEEPKAEVAPEDKPVDIGQIPGVKEVYIKPTMTKAAEQKAAFMDPKTGKPLDFSMKRFLQETMNGGMINRLVKRYDLQGVDIEKEFELVQKKESRLSASKRKAVVALYNMRKQQKQLLADIGKELLKKDSPSDDDLRALLDSVEDAHINQEEATLAVAQDIVQRALAEKINPPKEDKKEEVPAVVQEAMEAAKVDYTPGEGGNDEVTTKALHDAVKNHGRTKFRGVFDSLDQVEDPQVGDVVHTIVTDDKGNHSGTELVYTYIGPNHWKLEGSYIQEELPGPVPEEPAKPDDGSIALTIG